MLEERHIAARCQDKDTYTHTYLLARPQSQFYITKTRKLSTKYKLHHHETA